MRWITLALGLSCAWGNFFDLRPGIVYTYKDLQTHEVVLRDSVLREQKDSVCINSSNNCKSIVDWPIARQYFSDFDSTGLELSETTWMLDSVNLAFVQEAEGRPETWLQNGSQIANAFTMLGIKRASQPGSVRLARTIISDDSSLLSLNPDMLFSGYKFDDTASTQRFNSKKVNGNFVRSQNEGYECSHRYRAVGLMGLGLLSVEYPPPGSQCVDMAYLEPAPYYNSGRRSYYLSSVSLNGDTLYQSTGSFTALSEFSSQMPGADVWEIYDAQGHYLRSVRGVSEISGLAPGYYWALGRKNGQLVGQRIWLER